MASFSPWIMRRLHGDGPQGRTCGDCCKFVGIEDALDQGDFDPDKEGYCGSTQASGKKFIVDKAWLACALFKSHEAADKELLEALG